jgi:hypothetical protein
MLSTIVKPASSIHPRSISETGNIGKSAVLSKLHSSPLIMVKSFKMQLITKK